MFKTFIDAFKIKDLRKKMIITLILLLVYRVGCWLTIPGIDPETLAGATASTTGVTFLSLMNSISGGALGNASFFALGVSPYISASIIVQLLAFAIPSLQRLAKEGGEEGRRKMNLYNRIAALVLAVAQSIGIVVSYANTDGFIDPNMLGANTPIWISCALIVLIMVAGSMFTVWLGERITDLGVGNGLSLLIFVGILSSAGTALLQAFQSIGTNPDYIWKIIIFFVAVVAIFAFIVFIDSSERKIPVTYSQQIRGRKSYGGTQVLPIKVNSAGVMPIIFANAIITFPQMLISMFWADTPFAEWWNTWLGAGSWVYIVITALFILLFTFFYAPMVFDPQDVSKRLKQSGGFIQGRNPGPSTAEYLSRVSKRLNWFCALYLAFIALVPSLAFNAIATTTSDATLINAFSATGLMIVVSVALELDKQLSAQTIARTHRGFLK